MYTKLIVILVYSSQNEIMEIRKENEKKLIQYENEKRESLAVRDSANRDGDVGFDFFVLPPFNDFPLVYVVYINSIMDVAYLFCRCSKMQTMI